MTKTQISYIVTTVLEDATDTYTKLNKCKYITLSKPENIYCGRDDLIMEFDMDNELLITYPCKKISTNPTSGVFVTIDNEKYQLLSDTNSNVLATHYPFSEIILFKLAV